MKKILHVLSSNIFSGAENMVCQIIDIFKTDNEYDMMYCSKDGKIKEILEEKNLEYSLVKSISIKNLKELKDIINQYNPDIIHAHDAKASVISSLVCGNRKLISHIHGNHDDMKIVSAKSVIYMLSSIKYKHILWVSQSSLDGYKFKKSIYKKSTVLQNVIDKKSIQSRMSNDIQSYKYDCVFLGRLCDIKDPLRLIRILSLVKKEIPNIKAALIGNGELYDECSNLIRVLGLEDNIFMLGFKKNPLKILSNAKVMIMTSKYEGTPMCILEAMALGIPVVSTPTDGIKDVVVNGITGFLSNDDEDLSEYIVSILSDSEMQAKMSKASYRESEKINNILKYKMKLEKIYN